MRIFDQLTGFPARAPARGRSRAELGFTYLMALLLVALCGLGTLMLSTQWALAGQRAREQELLFAGREIRAAIGRYYEASPGTLKIYPRTLEDLLQDQRHLGIKRHLRRVYVDAMTNEPRWGLIDAPDGGIMGVYSQSRGAPLNRGRFRLEEDGFQRAQTYQDWRFVYAPR